MMRKLLISGTILLLLGANMMAQAVKDRNVIPVAVNLNQVLRMTITNGGNIEFVFNTVEDYRNGLSSATVGSGAMYTTDFTVASSTRWQLSYGAEAATFIGTDDPGHTLALDNVGFLITETGTYDFNATTVAPAPGDPEALCSAPTDNALQVTALQAYPVVLIEDSESTTVSNAGDATENSFTLNWRCGTSEANAVIAGNSMNATSLMNQNPSPAPDRYVVNVLFDLAVK
jgi:hypothetical protein